VKARIAAMQTIKKTYHNTFTDRLIEQFNLQEYAGHYFVVGPSNNGTTTQKSVVIEQQKRKLNIAGESKRRTQGKEDDEDTEDHELEIDGGILTVKIEPMTRDTVDEYKKLFTCEKGELKQNNWVYKDNNKKIARFNDGKIIDIKVPEFINEFTLSGFPIISRVYIYQKTSINMSSGVIQTKIK